MRILSILKKMMLFITIWIFVFGAVCYIFPLQYFNEKFTEAYHIDQTQKVDRSQDVAVDDSGLTKNNEF